MLQVFDQQGREVDILINGIVFSGIHIVSWDTGMVNPGIYVYKMTADNQIRNGKILLIK